MGDLGRYNAGYLGGAGIIGPSWSGYVFPVGPEGVFARVAWVLAGAPLFEGEEVHGSSINSSCDF